MTFHKRIKKIIRRDVIGFNYIKTKSFCSVKDLTDKGKKQIG